MANEAETIAIALGELSSVACVTRGWPTDQTALPCIAVMLGSEAPQDYRDDDEYLTELEYTLHIFAATAAACDTVAGEADDAMRTLGYRRTFAYEQMEQGAAHTVRRYRKFV